MKRKTQVLQHHVLPETGASLVVNHNWSPVYLPYSFYQVSRTHQIVLHHHKYKHKAGLTTRFMAEATGLGSSNGSVQYVSLWKKNSFPSVSFPGPSAVWRLRWTFLNNKSAFPGKAGYMTCPFFLPEPVYFRLPEVKAWQWLSTLHNC